MDEIQKDEAPKKSRRVTSAEAPSEATEVKKTRTRKTSEAAEVKSEEPKTEKPAEASEERSERPQREFDGEKIALQAAHHIGAQGHVIVVANITVYADACDSECRVARHPPQQHEHTHHSHACEHQCTGDVHQTHIQCRLLGYIVSQIHGVACFHACISPRWLSKRAVRKIRKHNWA